MHLSYMPRERVAKCSAKLEKELLRHATFLFIKTETLYCELPDNYGGFGGFSYRLNVRGVDAEISVRHSLRDQFTLHLVYLKYSSISGDDFARHAATVSFNDLIKRLRVFTETAIIEGADRLQRKKLYQDTKSRDA